MIVLGSLGTGERPSNIVQSAYKEYAECGQTLSLSAW